jgi:hypothetical protein
MSRPTISSFSSRQEQLALVKTALRQMDMNESRLLDKTNPRYNQQMVDRMYMDLKRIKGQAADMLTKQLSDSERADYETALRDIDEHIANFEGIVSNGLAGGKRKNKRSYKKRRHCYKKTRRCRKKRTSRRK